MYDYWSRQYRVYDCEEQNGWDFVYKGQHLNCADYVFICGNLNNGVIKSLSWDGDGTIFMYASCGILCHNFINKHINEVLVQSSDIFNYFVNDDKNNNLLFFDIFKDVKSLKGIRSITTPLLAFNNLQEYIL